MSVVVVATITPKPGEEEAVREAILAAAPKVHGEPGCELYAAHEADGAFVMVEKWESPEALATHGVVRGGWLAVRRVGRCHPWNPGGIDHVPGRPSEAPAGEGLPQREPGTGQVTPAERAKPESPAVAAP